MLRCLLSLRIILYLIISGNCEINLLGHDVKNDNWLISSDNKNELESTHSHVFAESIPLLSSRTDILRRGRVHHDYVHEVTFVIKQRNMDEVTRVLHDVSDPLSANYGQHWTRQDVVDFTANPKAYDAVLSYLHSRGASIVSETLGREFITVRGPIKLWEVVFNTEFYTFHQTQSTGSVRKVVRAEKYWIPRELESHLQTVFDIIDMPIKLHRSETKSLKKSKSDIIIDDPTKWVNPDGITPYKLKTYYNMSNSVRGNNFSTQAAFASLGSYLSPADVFFFQNIAGLPHQQINSIGNHSNDNKCFQDETVCLESNLDIQYITSMSPESPTTFWYTDTTISQWLIDISNSVDIPKVISISYSSDEKLYDIGQLNAFATTAIKLGTMGVTIFAASGDDGANGPLAANDETKCGYEPQFPSVSPYVTSVGATSVSNCN